MEIKILNTDYGDLLKKAAHVYDEQHQAIAQNIANSNTDNYKRVNTDFSEKLKSVIDNSGIRASREKHIQHASWKGEGSLGSPNNPESDVELAREMTDLSANQIRHELVTRALSRYYSGLTTAILGRNR
ncbi:MAG: hypothetical protein U9Q77_01250 [Candidatus Marinimicrobia bacterium]|nr:hypothetical protein [Candidatus Neomarinimicrobiota bacterium]